MLKRKEEVIYEFLIEHRDKLQELVSGFSHLPVCELSLVGWGHIVVNSFNHLQAIMYSVEELIYRYTAQSTFKLKLDNITTTQNGFILELWVSDMWSGGMGSFREKIKFSFKESEHDPVASV